MKRILVHCCCAPDALYCLRFLKEEGKYLPEAYFYNPNIYPESEYRLRLDEMRKVCKELDVPLHDEPYDPTEFETVSTGFETELEGGYRCALCYDFRLQRTAKKAREEGFDAFTAVLTISPHKSADLIYYFGRKSAVDNGSEFVFYDFKKRGGFQESVTTSKKLGLYRQNYCGCKFSVRD